MASISQSASLVGTLHPQAELIGKMYVAKTMAGIDGKSAYEIAVDNGYVGSEVEWLESLKGANGAPGVDGKDGYTPQKGVDYFDGLPGANGQDGITPHIGNNGNWFVGDVDTGNPSRGETGSAGAPGSNGTNGQDGKSAYEIAVSHGYNGTESQWLESIRGIDGKDGIPGRNGLNGQDGVSVIGATLIQV